MKVITGSTGGVGGRAAAVLSGQGHALRLLVRDPARAPTLPRSEVVRAGYGDGEALARGMNLGDTVFMVSVNAPHDERMAAHGDFIAAAARAGVGHIVYLSFVNAALDAIFHHSVGHAETEALIRETGVPFTFLRTGYYNRIAGELGLTRGLHLNGTIHGAGGDGRVAWVDRDDCGDAVAAVMADPAPHAGRTYDISGPASLSLWETSDLVSRVAGVDYRYLNQDYDPEELAARTGYPLDILVMRRTTMKAIAAGEFDLVSDALPRLIGRPATSLEDFVRANPALFPPVR